MHTQNIIIRNLNFGKKFDSQYERWIHLANEYIAFLERNGQIVSENHQFILKDNVITIPVICLEEDSLNENNASSYCLKVLDEMAENNGVAIAIQHTGIDANNPIYKLPTNPSYYILRFGWESPLLCGDTHKPVPLYKIPYTDHGGMDFDNIYFWKRDYEKLHGLWISSGAYESFAQKQLQDPRSEINTIGREICKHIEDLTGIPTYYFLFNYRDITTQKDRERKCPITDLDWYVEGATSSDFIAFKSDGGRLVSELSTNS